jgi:hypothetical protein
MVIMIYDEMKRVLFYEDLLTKGALVDMLRTRLEEMVNLPANVRRNRRKVASCLPYKSLNVSTELR